MTRAIAGILMMAMLAAAPAEARGHHGGGFLFFRAHHAHPINAWMGSRRLHLR